MKQLLTFILLVIIFTSCSIERRHYLPGYHIEVRSARGEVRGAKDEVHSDKVEKYDDNLTAGLKDEVNGEHKASFETAVISEPAAEEQNSSSKADALRPSHFALRTSPLVLSTLPLEPDTLKKPFKPQQQYREVDPVGKASVIIVLAGVALQKIAGLLTWYDVVMPLMMGPGIFIPALIVALIGVGLSAYSAYRVRKYPEKYKKNEWGKAALAILGWQILMTVLFAWLLV
jgi:hypothetical protein